MIWQPEFTDKTLSRKPGAVHWHLVVSVRNNLKTRTSLRPVSILRGWDQSQEMSFPKRWIGIQRGELKF
ncbi:hypothetical protein HUS2011_pII0061 (plasmid) [Escherichia coli]|nr:hypothetical protein HUS2011_pII0061 [Escherichia coli]